MGILEIIKEEKLSYDFFLSLKWPDGKPVCPYCSCSKSYVIENGFKFKCGNASCYKKYSLKIKTIVQDSKLKYNKLLYMVYSYCKTLNYNTSKLSREASVTQRTAWIRTETIIKHIAQFIDPVNNIEENVIVASSALFKPIDEMTTLTGEIKTKLKGKQLR